MRIGTQKRTSRHDAASGGREPLFRHVLKLCASRANDFSDSADELVAGDSLDDGRACAFTDDDQRIGKRRRVFGAVVDFDRFVELQACRNLDVRSAIRKSECQRGKFVVARIDGCSEQSGHACADALDAHATPAGRSVGFVRKIVCDGARRERNDRRKVELREIVLPAAPATRAPHGQLFVTG
jgi:hypothetical protein